MGIDAAITLLLALIENVQRVSQIIGQAKAAGRDTLSADEWAGILSADDAARAALAPAGSTPPAGSTSVRAGAQPLAGDPLTPEGT